MVGPAILIQDVSTVVVEPGCTATVSPFGDVAIEVGDVAGGSGDGSDSSGGRKRVKLELDPVYLSIFAHRFMGIAEQMGRTLQVSHLSIEYIVISYFGILYEVSHLSIEYSVICYFGILYEVSHLSIEYSVIFAFCTK